MDFIQFMKNNGINYRDRRGIAPYNNGSRTMAISAIAIHHSGANVDQPSEVLEGYWGGSLGWGTGGYHVVIRRNAEATVEFNYDPARISNGVGNHNGYIFNISVEGSSNFTDRQNEVLKLVTRFWKDQLGLPYTAILGHNEFSGHYTNTCPGRNMANFRAQINAMPAADQITGNLQPVAQPEVVLPYRRPVSYDATIASGGYSIDSKPWGEDGRENWGYTDDHIGKTFYFYEENYSGEYANAKGVGWIDKRALAKEKTVVASILYLPDGRNWTVYDEGSEYKVGNVVSTEAPGEDDGLYLTVLGDKGNNILIVDLPDIGKKAIYFDPDKGATITQKFA
nr:N-acetylmuramoyl-L-alanine amidase [uncultured Trichococcus sp.]